eukprot:3288133-Prymnesium_polylepis.1
MRAYEAALTLQARLEEPWLKPAVLARLVASKFDVVLSCQCYGEQRRAADPKAADVELLLRLLPGVAVCYIDRTPTVDSTFSLGGLGGGGGGEAGGGGGGGGSFGGG